MPTIQNYPPKSHTVLGKLGLGSTRNSAAGDASGAATSSGDSRDSYTKYNISATANQTKPTAIEAKSASNTAQPDKIVQTQSLAFVKTSESGYLEKERPINSQIEIVYLPNNQELFSSLHNMVSSYISPYFRSYVKQTQSNKNDNNYATNDSNENFESDKMAQSVEKTIAQLEAGLLHLQQNIGIPEVTLQFHPTISEACEIARKEGTRATVQVLGNIVDNANYLNALQAQVNRWIKEIKKVTEHKRDPKSGTAVQEISFWISMEKALMNLQNLRNSQEVVLTLDVLKHGKRFHATTSFDSDTGLRQALNVVSDSTSLMKDFPINELLSATSIQQAKDSIIPIFIHLKRIRQCQEYSANRALRFTEAISRDLQDQLLKILGPRMLLHVDYEEFEMIIADCMELFNCWDEEHEKFQGILRTQHQSKKSAISRLSSQSQPHGREKDSQEKIHWRHNTAHRDIRRG